MTTAADVPQEQKAGWTSFIKSLAHMTGDLSSMTAPPCTSSSSYSLDVRADSAIFGAVILSPISLTEFPAYWCEHPHLFATISEGLSKQDRMERVLRWFIGTLKAQYTVRRDRHQWDDRAQRCFRRVTRRWDRRRRSAKLIQNFPRS